MDKRCECCKFCCSLNVFDRRIETIGSHNVISGVKIVKSNSKFIDSYCCSVFFNQFNIINETMLNDKCELFQPKEKEDELYGEK